MILKVDKRKANLAHILDDNDFQMAKVRFREQANKTLESVVKDMEKEIRHLTKLKKEYEPYLIGKIIAGKNKIKLDEKINWS